MLSVEEGNVLLKSIETLGCVENKMRIITAFRVSKILKKIAEKC